LIARTPTFGNGSGGRFFKQILQKGKAVKPCAAFFQFKKT
jgi:hypothetical protein